MFSRSWSEYALVAGALAVGGSLKQAAGNDFASISYRGEIIRCPWHSWEFDIRTGKSWCDPEKVKARRFGVSVEKGAKLVEGPYVAETFRVSVENDYVVVEA